MKRIIFVSATVFCLCGSVQAMTVDLGKIVVTASRLEQSDYKITSNITVIGKEEIQASNAQNIPDILEEALGVNVFDNSTSKTSKLDIRGFGDTAKSSILFLVNDRKTNSVDMSGADLLQIPLDAVEKIEIIRGAGSVLYGDNAVGGVVNIITKKGAGTISGKTTTTYGSYDRRSVDVEVSGEKKGLSYYIYSRYLDDRGYRQNSDTLAKDYNMRLGYKFSDRLFLDFEAGLHEDDYGQPGSLTLAQIESLGRRGVANEEDTASTDDSFVNFSFDVNPWPQDNYLGKLVVDFSFRNRDTYTDNVAWSSDTKNRIDTKGITAKYIFDRTIFDKEVNFVTGIDYYDNENEITREDTSTTEYVISKEEFGVYGFLDYEIRDHVYVNGGTRFHKADYNFNTIGGGDDEKKDPDEWVSMGGIKYEYAKGSNIFLNVQQTFRFLATDEWLNTITGVLNTDLSQQRGIQYEVGIKHNFDDKIVASITPYWIDIKDEIYYNPQGGLWGWGANENYDRTRRIGVEVGSEFDILKFIEIGFLDKCKYFVNYTYQDPQFSKGDYNKKDIPLVPHHQVSTGLILKFGDYYKFSLSGKYVGSRFAGSDTQNVLPKEKPYVVMDAKLSYERKNLEVFAEFNNILNEKYSSYVTSYAATKYYYPDPEMNFNIGMSLKF